MHWLLFKEKDMGQAAKRGTFEERKAQAIAAGREITGPRNPRIYKRSGHSGAPGLLGAAELLSYMGFKIQNRRKR